MSLLFPIKRQCLDLAMYYYHRAVLFRENQETQNSQNNEYDYGYELKIFHD